MLERHLSAIGKTIRHVPRDGLCILRSVQEAFIEKGTFLSIDQLKMVLKKEIQSGKYKEFSDDKRDSVKVLEDFYEKPGVHYVDPTVDLFLPALLTGLSANGTMHKIDEYGRISAYMVGSEVSTITGLAFAQTSIRHIDAVVDVKIEEAEKKPYICDRCRKEFGGPKRLDRHKCPGEQVERSTVRIPGIIVIDCDDEPEQGNF